MRSTDQAPCSVELISPQAAAELAENSLRERFNRARGERGANGAGLKSLRETALLAAVFPPER